MIKVKKVDMAISSTENTILARYAVYEVTTRNDEYVYLVHVDSLSGMFMGNQSTGTFRGVKKPNVVFGALVGSTDAGMMLVHCAKVEREQYFLQTLSGETNVEDYFLDENSDHVHKLSDYTTQMTLDNYAFRFFTEYSMRPPVSAESEKDKQKLKDNIHKKSADRMQQVADRMKAAYRDL